MRRKVLAMVLGAVMTAGVLAGCGNSSAEKSTADTKGTDSKEATYTVEFPSLQSMVLWITAVKDF